MNNEVVNESLKHISSYELIMWIIFVIAIISLIVGVTIKLYKIVEKYRKIRNNVETKDEKIESLEKTVSDIKIWTKAQSVALKVILANELDRKYRYYLELQYIPDKEFDEYVDMHDAYNGLGGNHHGDEKFNYVMEHLERKIDIIK